jgi:hypothetical protein
MTSTPSLTKHGQLSEPPKDRTPLDLASDTWSTAPAIPNLPRSLQISADSQKVNAPVTSQLAPPHSGPVHSGRVIIGRNHALPALVPKVCQGISGLNLSSEVVLDLNRWLVGRWLQYVPLLLTSRRQGLFQLQSYAASSIFRRPVRARLRLALLYTKQFHLGFQHRGWEQHGDICGRLNSGTSYQSADTQYGRRADLWWGDHAHGGTERSRKLEVASCDHDRIVDARARISQ